MHAKHAKHVLLLLAIALASRPGWAASPSLDDHEAARPAPAKAGHAKRKPHTVSGDGKEEGKASYYSRQLAGRRTSSGERYDPSQMTAAHRSLPLGTQVKVVNPKNDRSVVVTVNDRGPMHKGRMIDLSHAAASELGMTKAGVTKVETEVVGKKELPKAPP